MGSVTRCIIRRGAIMPEDKKQYVAKLGYY